MASSRAMSIAADGSASRCPTRCIGWTFDRAERIPPPGRLSWWRTTPHSWTGRCCSANLPRRVSFLVKAEAVNGRPGLAAAQRGPVRASIATCRTEPSLLDALAQLKAGGAIGDLPGGHPRRRETSRRCSTAPAGWRCGPAPRCCRWRCAEPPVPAGADDGGRGSTCWSGSRSTSPPAPAGRRSPTATARIQGSLVRAGRRARPAIWT